MTNYNRCPIDGCTKGRGSGKLMCKSHWFKVPKDLRDRVWSTAKKMWAEEEPGGPAYQEWSETRDEAIVAVELAEAERG